MDRSDVICAHLHGSDRPFCALECVATRSKKLGYSRRVVEKISNSHDHGGSSVSSEVFGLEVGANWWFYYGANWWFITLLKVCLNYSYRASQKIRT